MPDEKQSFPGGRFHPKYIPKTWRIISKSQCPKWNDLERFERERKALQKLHHHSRIAQLFEIKVNGENFEILVEQSEHGSLRDVYSTPRYIYSMKTVLDWASQLFHAIVELSNKGISHKDISPENVIVRQDFSLKLAYFGTEATLTGNQRYQSPESFNGEDREMLFKDDIYSIGLLIWEMIERRRVFEEYESETAFLHEQLFADLKNGKFVLPWANCRNHITVIVEICTRVNPNDRPGAWEALDFPYRRRKETFSVDPLKEMKGESIDSTSPKIRVDEQRLIRPIGLDGTADEVFIEKDCSTKSKYEKTKEIFEKSEKIVENCRYGLDLDEKSETWASDSFFGFLAGKWDGKCDLRKKTEFRKALNNDLLFFLLSENLEASNNLLENYVYLIDEKPKIKNLPQNRSQIFELMGDLNEPQIRMISIFLSRQTVLIQELSTFLHQKMSEFFDVETNLPFSTESLIIKNDLDSLLRSFTHLQHFYNERFSNPCLDLPNPEEISLRLAVYLSDQSAENSTKNSWVLLSKKEKLFIKIDFSEKANLRGDFSETFHEFHMENGQILHRRNGIGFNYQRFSNFDEKNLTKNFEIKEISRIPRLFDRHDSFGFDYPLVSYIFQLNVSPMEWPWIIYSELSNEQLKEYQILHDNISKRLLGANLFPYFPNKAPDFFNFLLHKGYSRPARPRILEIPTKDEKSVKYLNSWRLVVDNVLSFDAVNEECYVPWNVHRIEMIIQDNKPYYKKQC